MAFLTDEWGVASIRVAQVRDDVTADVLDGQPTDSLGTNVQRMLSLDVDSRDYDRIDDPVVAEIRLRSPGLRPVLFPTPYEAACWAVLSQRDRMSHASAVRHRLAAEHGEVVTIDGSQYATFPAPSRLQQITMFEGVPDVKLARLRAVAGAALDGRLDAVQLRALDPDDALEHLQRIDGIGTFGAQLILIRGAGTLDVLPTREPRLLSLMASMYHVDRNDRDAFQRVADRWRPFRSWVSFLIRQSA
ncbi:MAG: HhH-GPD family protein [Ilumatobacteraceae bacterium]|nr:HhH-GPD family protein [Ilumatobacteraceae bacterium]